MQRNHKQFEHSRSQFIQLPGYYTDTNVKAKRARNQDQEHRISFNEETKHIFSYHQKHKSKKDLFKMMMKSKCSYGIEALIKHDPKYEKKWNSTLYRLLKKLFSIKWNISKKKLFDTLNLNNEKLKIQRN